MMHRRSFLAVGTTAAIAPGAICDRALGAIGRQLAPPSVGVLSGRATLGARHRLTQGGDNTTVTPARSVRIEALHVPDDRARVAIELMRETTAGLIGSTLWAMNDAPVRSVGAPVGFNAPTERTMRLRVDVDGVAHNLTVPTPSADGRGSSLIAVPLRRGVGAPVWRLWSAEFGADTRLTRVHRPLGLPTNNDGRLLIAVTPCHTTL